MNRANPVSPCCNAPTTFYDGALGYESFTCDKCGKDIADATPPAYTNAELVTACRAILWPSGHPRQDREKEWTCDHLEALASALELPTKPDPATAALAETVTALKLFLEQYAHGMSPIEHSREQRPEVIAARAAIATAERITKGQHQ